MAMNRIQDELRNATRTAPASPPNISIPGAPNNISIQFYLPNQDEDGINIDAFGNTQWNTGNPITYVYVPGIQLEFPDTFVTLSDRDRAVIRNSKRFGVDEASFPGRDFTDRFA